MDNQQNPLGGGQGPAMPTPNPTVPEPSVPEPTTPVEPVTEPQPDQSGGGDAGQQGGDEPAPVV